MASPDRQTANSVIAELAADPTAFDFYAAVRRLQSELRSSARIGYSSALAQDPVRFAQSPALEFAPATLEAFRQKDPARPPVIYCRHFGLFGPNGPLPLCLTEYARDRILHHSDPTFAAFCNIFQHRLLSFFFRAWADAHKTVDFDRPEDEHWTHYLRSLVGLGMESLLDRDSVPDHAKMYYAGRLVQQNRNAEGLAAVLRDFFGVATEVQTFVGRWLRLPPNAVCYLGRSRETGTLGSTILAGARFWTCQLHFRLHLGPMSFADFERLLPSGPAFKRLCDWVRNYVGDEFTWDVRMVLARAEVPKIQMGRAGRLGWTTWLKTRSFDRDADDLILCGSA